MYKVLAIRRDDRFSPNSVERDRAILQAVVERLGGVADCQAQMVDEAEIASHPICADTYLSMARSEEALATLCKAEDAGRQVVNSAYGVLRCRRFLLDGLMRRMGIAMPPMTGNHGFWLKRGDAAAQSKDDVVYCADEEKLAAAKARFRERGIAEMVVSTNMVGDLVKFYGVGHSMFRYFYPSDDNISKFGDERRNGKAHYYPFSEQRLRAEVHRLADAVGVAVYGGDAIVDEQGNFYIIDFNDWPSFSRCREEAAEAICSYFRTKAEAK